MYVYIYISISSPLAFHHPGKILNLKRDRPRCGWPDLATSWSSKRAASRTSESLSHVYIMDV